MSKVNISDIFQQFSEVTQGSNKLGAICKSFIKQEGRDKISSTVKQVRSVCNTLESMLSDGVEEVEEIEMDK